MNFVEHRARAALNSADAHVRNLNMRSSSTPVFLVMLAFTVGLAPFMMLEDLTYGIGLALGALVAVVVLVLTVRAPVFGFYILAFVAVVIEEEALATPIGTDRLNIFSWPVRLSGLPERPIGFYILILLVLVMVANLALRKSAALRGGPLIVPFLMFLGCVAIGVIHGVSSGGQVRIIVLEVRPFWYLFTTYLVAYNVITEKRHVMGFFWILVLGTFFKGLQGCYIVITALHGHINSDANEIMAHEQSYFFIMIFLLILLCVLMKRMRALMWVSIASLPFVTIALIANNRRADYLALVLGAVAVWLLAIRINAARRRQLIIGFIVTATLMGGYILVFSSVKTPISSPAQSIISVIHPSATDLRDLASNLYRDNEDFDLKYTEKQSPILGYGFGKPFLTPDPLPNLIGLDPYYLYIPHNNILWIWMRLGPVGYIAFWYLFGAAIVRGGVIAKRLRDPDLQLVALFAIGCFVMEIPLAYGDYQIYFYRNVFITGLLMGMLLRLPAIDAKGAVEAVSDTLDRNNKRPNRLSYPVAAPVRSGLSMVGALHQAPRQEPKREPAREPVGATVGASASSASNSPDPPDLAGSPRSTSARLRARFASEMWQP
jgi:hypothetical protein